ncbi:MAG TPA: hypothetical protein VGG48_18810 [Rhizomicrobium sp.]|jgi:hypothetical protein
MRFAILAVALLCFTGTALADATTDDASEADVRCLVVAINMSEGNATALKLAGTMSALYFLGRIDARSPDMDLEAHLIAELKKMTPEDVKEEAVRCGGMLQARGAYLKDMGEDMIRKGQAEDMKKSEKGA